VNQTRHQRKNQTKPKRDPNTPLRVVIVTRLSRSKRKTNAEGERELDFTSHETQEAGCRRKILERGWECVAVFHDDNVGGDRIYREGLQNAIELIKAGEADALMTYATDRLSRDQIKLAVIIHEVRKAGGQVFSATEDLETGPLGDFLRSALGLAGALQLVGNREKVNRSFNKRYVQAQRKRPGPKPMLGYKKNGNGADATYDVNEAEAEVVRRIFELTAAGVSQREIAERFTAEGVPGSKNWSSSIIGGILDRKVYWTGLDECWKTQTVRDPRNDNIPETVERPVDERYYVEMPAFLDPAIAKRAQSARERNRWKTRRADRDPSIGILRYGFACCAGCGRALSVVPKSRGEGFRYRCPNSDCASHVSMEVAGIDEGITEWVKEVILNPTRAASRYVVKEETPKVDPELQLRLAEAEAEVSKLDSRILEAFDNLEGLPETAKNVIKKKIEGMSADFEEAASKRDKLAEQVKKQTGPTKRMIRRTSPETTITKACETALKAGWDAYRDWIQTNTCKSPALGYLGEPSFEERLSAEEWVVKEGVILPDHASPAGWQAWQTVLSTLEVEVTLNQERQETPRWEARMTLPGGDVIWNMPATSRSRWR
jgi:DNA invertase Pin-like site-specific DNA recombinase